MAMALKSRDILAFLQLLSIGLKDWTCAWLGAQLDMSPSRNGVI